VPVLASGGGLSVGFTKIRFSGSTQQVGKLTQSCTGCPGLDGSERFSLVRRMCVNSATADYFLSRRVIGVKIYQPLPSVGGLSWRICQ